jgi:hypothetical protein
MGGLRSRMMDSTRDRPRRPPIDSADLVRQVRHLARVARWSYAVCLAIMALPAFYVVRFGGLLPAQFLLGAVAFPVFITATLFPFGVSRLTSGVSMRVLCWHGAFWAVVLAVATPLLADHVEAIGWGGAGWVRFPGVAAIVGGLPLGAWWSARVLAQRHQRASWLAGLAAREVKSAATALWGDELNLTYEAIRKWYGRNAASSNYGLSASEALGRLMKSDELAETNPARIAALRAFRAKVEAGLPPW